MARRAFRPAELLAAMTGEWRTARNRAGEVGIHPKAASNLLRGLLADRRVERRGVGSIMRPYEWRLAASAGVVAGGGFAANPTRTRGRVLDLT